jgi:hypothetical protein
MYAKNLERLLGPLCEHSDLSHSLPDEHAERFKSLRGSGLLPRGRERREEQLSNAQIAAAVFGLVRRGRVGRHLARSSSAIFGR